MTQVYWHTRKSLWSLREGGRVVEHRPEVRLWNVSFVVKPSAVARIQLRGQREVCAWAEGRLMDDVPEDEFPDRGMARVAFRPFERPDFHHAYSGRTLVGCQLLMLEANGEAWGWVCR